jgi:putative ABC transport system permease protein
MLSVDLLAAHNEDMIGTETWDVAVSALLTNKVKTALTMLGVTVGSACLVLVVTISLIGRNYVIGQIEGIGSNLVYAYLPGNQFGRSLADQISIDDLNTAAELPYVGEVAGVYDINGAHVVSDGKERPVALIGVTIGYQAIRNLLILKGRFFDSIDMQTNAKAALLSQGLANQFQRDMIGRVIRVGDLRFIVIGIFRERVASLGQSELATKSILIPLPVMKLYTGEEYLRTLYVRTDSQQNVLTVTDEVRQMLEARHRRGVVYNVENLSAILDAAKNISRTLTVVLIMVGCIALLVSGVGIMNIMFVTVTERTREIGLRKAVGARRRKVLHQFLLEAFLISGSGALLGILIPICIKCVIEPLVPTEYDIHIPISYLSIAISFIVSCGTGLLFGYLPASKASKLQPIESLHHE